MSDSFSIFFQQIPEESIENKRLGRHVHQDSRSLAYPVETKEWSTIASVIHDRKTPILDQGNLGSCTGNMMTGAIGTLPIYQSGNNWTLNESLAVKIYSAATVIDNAPGQYPPNDTGSDGLSVAKIAKQLGYISGYQWAFGLQAALSALQNGPVGTGVNWYSSFDHPDANGIVSISPDATVRGGHEFLVRGIDVERKLVLCDNSWGTTWGQNGSFWMSWDTWDRLLKEQGDVVQFVPLLQPAPTPIPPTPTPTPTPTPVNVDDALAKSLNAWLNKHPYMYRSLQSDAIVWLKAKGYR